MQRSETQCRRDKSSLRQSDMIENSDEITRTKERQMHSNVFKQ